ncbi:MAG: hypothetical protein WD066_16710 [Planctomycetaceae bacterium]
MDDSDRKAVASLRERLQVAEGKLRRQQRFIAGCVAGLVIVVSALFIPAVGAVVGGILLVAAILFGVLLFISLVMALLEWLSPTDRIPR